jgi:hypothetical protein
MHHDGRILAGKEEAAWRRWGRGRCRGVRPVVQGHAGPSRRGRRAANHAQVDNERTRQHSADSLLVDAFCFQITC